MEHIASAPGCVRVDFVSGLVCASHLVGFSGCVFGVQANERAVMPARSCYELSCSEMFVLYTTTLQFIVSILYSLGGRQGFRLGYMTEVEIESTMHMTDPRWLPVGSKTDARSQPNALRDRASCGCGAGVHGRRRHLVPTTAQGSSPSLATYDTAAHSPSTQDKPVVPRTQSCTRAFTLFLTRTICIRIEPRTERSVLRSNRAL